MPCLKKVSKRLALLFVFGMAFFIFISSCSQRKSATTTGGTGETQTEEGTTPSGTAGNLPPPSVNASPIFPHSKSWGDPASHGVWVVQNNITVCLKCHEAGATVAKAATTGGAPACASCHKLFPHPADWLKKENHGAHVLAKGKSTCATQCHGFDLKGGLSKRSCNSCHSIFPHSETWKSPSEHGEKAKGTDISLCKGCHGEDLKGGTSQISCYQCHENYPHENGWKNKEKHGAQVTANGKGACMTQCHGTDLKGGLSKVSCDTCHSLYPHSDTWVEEGHRTTVARLGMNVCKTCHGEKFEKILRNKNCYSCHEDYPHEGLPSWAAFEGHGNTVKTRAGTAKCEKGQGTNLNTVKKGQACFTCHLSFPHDKFSSPAVWKNVEGHGNYILNMGSETEENIKECRMCHGVNYEGGNRGQPPCFLCHVSYPHLKTQVGTGTTAVPWKDKTRHGSYVNANGTTSCATANCHGTNLIPEVNVTRGPSCAGCHNLYPHPENWAWSHGATTVSLEAGITACKNCHGDNYDRIMSNGKNCFSCHADYPHVQEGWVRPSGQPQGHGDKVQVTYNKSTAKCELCHGTDLTKMKAGKNCFTCHDSYPHKKRTTEVWKEYDGHGDYLLGQGEHQLEECNKCHGADYKGGTRGQPSCFSCHPSFPHKLISEQWNQYEGGHGNYVVAKTTGQNPTKKVVEECQQCHGADYAGGSHEQPACSNCHSYPHTTAEWYQPQAVGQSLTQRHGIEIANRTVAITSCARSHCHKVAGGVPATTNGPVCTICHAVYPHPANWRDASRHGNMAFDRETRRLDCATSNCHGTDFRNGLAPSCLTCHEFPHPSTWTTPGTQTTNASSRSNDFHGDVFIRKEKAARTSNTQNIACGAAGSCHGPDPTYDRTVNGVNCNTCHQSQTIGGLVLHQDFSLPWGEADAHGKYFSTLQQWTSATDNAVCWKCHGPLDAFRNYATTRPPWGATQSDCYTCHPYYPHPKKAGSPPPVSWKSGMTHGVYATESFTEADVQRSCYGGTNGSCHNRTRRPSRVINVGLPSCNFCHPTR